MRETTTVRRQVRLRPVRPAGWWWDLLLLAALVALTVALTTGHLFGLDRAAADWAETHRPTVAYWTARVFNFLGQGSPLTVIALLLGVAVGVRTRSVRPVLPPVTAYLLSGFTILPFKLWTDRPAPSASAKEPYLAPEQTLPMFQHDLPQQFVQSYPSGHVANAIVWYGIIALLLAALLRTLHHPLPPRLVTVIRVVPPLVVLCTTTYLGWHWLTDSVAGLLVGLLLDRLLRRVPWDDVPLPAALRRWDRRALFTPVA